MDCTFKAEQSFGPPVMECRREFDFTLFFEELFFKLLPSTLFLLLAIARVFVLAKSSPTLRFGAIYFAKIVRYIQGFAVVSNFLTPCRLRLESSPPLNWLS